MKRWGYGREIDKTVHREWWRGVEKRLSRGKRRVEGGETKRTKKKQETGTERERMVKRMC